MPAEMGGGGVSTREKERNEGGLTFNLTSWCVWCFQYIVSCLLFPLLTNSSLSLNSSYTVHKCSISYLTRQANVKFLKAFSWLV